MGSKPTARVDTITSFWLLRVGNGKFSRTSYSFWKTTARARWNFGKTVAYWTTTPSRLAKSSEKRDPSEDIEDIDSSSSASRRLIKDIVTRSVRRKQLKQFRCEAKLGGIVRKGSREI